MLKLTMKSLGQSLGTILLLGLFTCLSAQQPGQSTGIAPDDQDVVRITTNLVQVDAVVTDRDGRIVTNLGPADFKLVVNGRQQQITNLSFNSAAAISRSFDETQRNNPPAAALRPRQISNTFALVIDDYCMSFESFAVARQLARKFVDEKLQANDAAAVISTRLGTGTLQQFTTDRRLLNAVIQNLRWHPCRNAPESSSSSGTSLGDGAISRANSERVRDSFDRNAYGVATIGTLEYVAQGLADLPGRKAILMLSEGLPIQSRNTGELDGDVIVRLRRVIEKANRASAVVYTIHLRGLDPLFFTVTDGPSSPAAAAMSAERGLLAAKRREFNYGQDGLIYLAETTGGFAIRNTNDFSGGLSRAVDDQQGYYLIGYHPDATTFGRSGNEARFNSLTVSLNNHPDYRVRTRHGFSGVVLPEASTSKRPAAEQMIHGLRSPVGSDGLALRMTSLVTNKPDGLQLRSVLHLDARDLTFQPGQKGWRAALIDVVAVTLDARGSIVEQLTRSQTISIREDSYDQILNEGLVYVLDVPVRKAGPYEMRVAVKDLASARVGSARQFIEVPDLRRDRLVVSALVVSGRLDSGAGIGQERTAGLPFSGVPELASPSGPAVRKFKRNMTVDYGFEVYGARMRADKYLKAQIRLFRDGRETFAGEPQQLPAEHNHQVSVAGGSFQLGESLPIGWYTLEVKVTDGPKRNAVQWIEFEVVE